MFAVAFYILYLTRSSQQPYGRGPCITPISQMSKWRHREIRKVLRVT